MRLKAGVSLKGLTAPMCLGAVIVASVYARLCPGYDPWVTSGNDGTHGENTLHKRGGQCNAMDFRTKDYPEDRWALAKEIVIALGAEFDVVFEHPGEDNEHIHVEYDPK